MSDLLAVASTVRAGVSYLGRTLAALDEAGADSFACKMVFFDGGKVPTPGWANLTFPGPSGTRRAFRRIFQYAVDTKYDRLLFCEDDVIPCKNALRYIADFRIPDDVSFVDFFGMNETPKGAGPGIYRTPSFGIAPLEGRRETLFYCGNQCMLFPWRTLEYLVKQDLNDPEIPFSTDLSPTNSSDCVMGWHLGHSPWPKYGVHVPSLVEHAGDVSACRPSEARRQRAGSFLGVEFDALALEGRR